MEIPEASEWNLHSQRRVVEASTAIQRPEMKVYPA
jgi:hypothetical protein